MTDDVWGMVSTGPDMTRALGRAIGERLTAGCVIGLSGTLGCGKTTLIQGLARGLGVPADYPVTSPSYTLINVYPGRLPLYHADLYRLSGSDDLADIGLEDVVEENAVIVVEWIDRIASGDIGESLRIQMEIIDDDRRDIRLYPYGLDRIDLVKDIAKMSKESSWP